MTTVNRVDCVIHRPLHHGEAQYREGVRLSPGHDDRIGRDRVPVGHGVRARHRGRRESNERRCDEKW